MVKSSGRPAEKVEFRQKIVSQFNFLSQYYQCLHLLPSVASANWAPPSLEREIPRGHTKLHQFILIEK